MSTTVAERFNITTMGKGEKTLMFAHGLGCDQSMWRFITPLLEEDYKIVLFDHLGSGNSDLKYYEKSKYSSLDFYADDVIDIIKTFDLSEVIFIGHSVGSMIGMLAAIKVPEYFSHLIMVGPSPCYINFPGYTGGFEAKEIDLLLKQMKENLTNWSNQFAPTVMGNEDRPELANELKESFMSSDQDILYHFAQLTFRADLRSDVSKLKTPTLILQCNDDVIAPEEVGEFMHHQITGSHLVKMKATGHCAHLSEPNETAALIRDYLEK